MLHQLALFQPDDIHHGFASFSRGTNPVAVQDHKISEIESIMTRNTSRALTMAR